jgi:hypothetical protein
MLELEELPSNGLVKKMLCLHRRNYNSSTKKPVYRELKIEML